jgi:hypothetical protein
MPSAQSLVWPSCMPPRAAPQDVARRAGQPTVRPRYRHRVREAALRLWQKNFPRSVRGRGPGMLVETIRSKAENARRGPSVRVQPKLHRPVSNLPVRGPQEKAALPMGPPVRVRYHRTSRPVLRVTRSARPKGHGAFSIGWTWRQPTPAGSTVRTSTGADAQPQQYPTGEAADTPHQREGQWRASTPCVKPRPRSDRAGRHKRPPQPSTTTGLRALPT